jgi:hypothetical protein
VKSRQSLLALGLCLALTTGTQAQPAEPVEPAPPFARPEGDRDPEVERSQIPGSPGLPPSAGPAIPVPSAPGPIVTPELPSPPAGFPGFARTFGGLSPGGFGATTSAQRARLARRTFNYAPIMIGDQFPFSIRQLPPEPPQTPSPRLASALTPSVRGVKIAENQSPRPQDRLFYSFNYFANINPEVNQRLDSPVTNLRAYRHVFGLEKTFNEGRGSFGLRLPLNTLTADNRIPARFQQFGGTDTALGDLSVFAKYVFEDDPATGNLVSAGLVITPPTGPDTFAGSRAVQGIHTTTFQPFLGYIWNYRKLYLHGFSAFDFPADPREATLIFNDVGLGYYLYRNPDPDGLLTTIAPTFEVHVSTPINHRDVFDPNDLGATQDVVNLTYGVNVGLSRGALLTFGFVTPVTSPKPFDYEATLLLNLRFGGSRAGRRAAPPVIGG